MTDKSIYAVFCITENRFISTKPRSSAPQACPRSVDHKINLARTKKINIESRKLSNLKSDISINKSDLANNQTIFLAKRPDSNAFTALEIEGKEGVQDILTEQFPEVLPDDPVIPPNGIDRLYEKTELGFGPAQSYNYILNIPEPGPELRSGAILLNIETVSTDLSLNIQATVTDNALGGSNVWKRLSTFSTEFNLEKIYNETWICLGSKSFSSTIIVYSGVNNTVLTSQIFDTYYTATHLGPILGPKQNSDLEVDTIARAMVVPYLKNEPIILPQDTGKYYNLNLKLPETKRSVYSLAIISRQKRGEILTYKDNTPLNVKGWYNVGGSGSTSIISKAFNVRYGAKTNNEQFYIGRVPITGEVIKITTVNFCKSKIVSKPLCLKLNFPGLESGVPVDADEFAFYDNGDLKHKRCTLPDLLNNLEIQDLGNVTIDNLQDCQILKWDQTSGEWKNEDFTLSNLADTELTTPQDCDVLVYNDTTNKFENKQNTVENLCNVDESVTPNVGDVIVFSSLTASQPWKAQKQVITDDTADPYTEPLGTISDPVETGQILQVDDTGKITNQTLELFGAPLEPSVPLGDPLLDCSLATIVKTAQYYGYFGNNLSLTVNSTTRVGVGVLYINLADDAPIFNQDVDTVIEITGGGTLSGGDWTLVQAYTDTSHIDGNRAQTYGVYINNTSNPITNIVVDWPPTNPPSYPGGASQVVLSYYEHETAGNFNFATQVVDSYLPYDGLTFTSGDITPLPALNFTTTKESIVLIFYYQGHCPFSDNPQTLEINADTSLALYTPSNPGTWTGWIGGTGSTPDLVSWHSAAYGRRGWHLCNPLPAGNHTIYGRCLHLSTGGNYDGSAYGVLVLDAQAGAPVVPQEGNTLVYNSTLDVWETRELCLDDLCDVTTNTLTNCDTLIYNGTSNVFENQQNTVENLCNTNISAIQNGDVLSFNQTANEWQNNQPLSSINGLTDVTLTTPQDCDVLVYNDTTNTFENKPNTVENLCNVDESVTPAVGDVIVFSSLTSLQPWKSQKPVITDETGTPYTQPLGTISDPVEEGQVFQVDDTGKLVNKTLEIFGAPLEPSGGAETLLDCNIAQRVTQSQQGGYSGNDPFTVVVTSNPRLGVSLLYINVSFDPGFSFPNAVTEITGGGTLSAGDWVLVEEWLDTSYISGSRNMRWALYVNSTSNPISNIVVDQQGSLGYNHPVFWYFEYESGGFYNPTGSANLGPPYPYQSITSYLTYPGTFPIGTTLALTPLNFTTTKDHLVLIYYYGGRTGASIGGWGFEIDLDNSLALYTPSNPGTWTGWSFALSDDIKAWGGGTFSRGSRFLCNPLPAGSHTIIARAVALNNGYSFYGFSYGVILLDAQAGTPVIPQEGNTLVFNSIENQWETRQLCLDDLCDVTTNTLADCDTLVYNGISNVFENQQNTVENLCNTNISAIQDNQILVYDNNSSNWLNQSATISLLQVLSSESLVLESSTNTAFTSKVTLALPLSGDYFVFYTAQISNSNLNFHPEMRLYDATGLVEYDLAELHTKGDLNTFTVYSGFIKLTGPITLNLEYRNTNAISQLDIKNTRLFAIPL